jgi:hypothetical protein
MRDYDLTGYDDEHLRSYKSYQLKHISKKLKKYIRSARIKKYKELKREAKRRLIELILEKLEDLIEGELNGNTITDEQLKTAYILSCDDYKYTVMKDIKDIYEFCHHHDDANEHLEVADYTSIYVLLFPKKYYEHLLCKHCYLNDKYIPNMEEYVDFEYIRDEVLDLIEEGKER